MSAVVRFLADVLDTLAIALLSGAVALRATLPRCPSKDSQGVPCALHVGHDERHENEGRTWKGHGAERRDP